MLNWQKSFPVLGILAIAISPLLVSFTRFPLPASNPAHFQEISLKFPAGKNRGAPVTTSGGGTRGDDTCVNTEEGELSLNALTPNYSNLASTATNTPTLYYYVPPTKATAGELVLIDDSNNEVYQTTFPLTNQPGIVRITIPKTASLQAGKTYQWSLMLICDPNSRDQDVFTEGELQYQQLNPKIQQSLENKDALEKAKIYAANGIWLETLDNTASVRPQYPTEWIELLKSVGLEAMSSLTLLDCCQASN